MMTLLTILGCATHSGPRLVDPRRCPEPSRTWLTDLLAQPTLASAAVPLTWLDGSQTTATVTLEVLPGLPSYAAGRRARCSVSNRHRDALLTVATADGRLDERQRPAWFEPYFTDENRWEGWEAAAWWTPEDAAQTVGLEELPEGVDWSSRAKHDGEFVGPEVITGPTGMREAPEHQIDLKVEGSGSIVESLEVVLVGAYPEYALEQYRVLGRTRSPREVDAWP